MSSRTSPQRGFSLIELMISIALGILVILGIGQIFVATRTSYAAQQGLSGMQQNVRVGVKIMGDAVRNGGDLGFTNMSGMMQGKQNVSNSSTATPGANDARNVFQVTNFAAAAPGVETMIRMESPITIYEYNGSAPGGTVTLPASLAAGAAGNWTPQLPAPLVSRALQFSDVIVTRYMDPSTLPLRPNGEYAAGVGDQKCTATDGFFIGSLEYITPDVAAELNALPQRLYAISDLSNVIYFQARNGGTDAVPVLRSDGALGIPGNIVGECGNTDKIKGEGGRMGKVHIEAYYIGMNPDTREPGLWRASFDGTAPDGFSYEELVEGVENLQIVAGLTMPPADPRQGISTAATDRIVTGAQLANPSSITLTETTIQASRRIMSVRMSALARSEANAAGEVNTQTYELARTTVNPSDDRRLRQVYEVSTGIRNRQRMASGIANFY